MHTYAIRSAVLSTVGLALAFAPGSVVAATYRLTDLGTLGGDYSEGYDLNDSGQVTGVAYTAGHEGHAFLWDGTRMQDLGTLGGTYSFGSAINASGQVTGYFDRRDGFTRAFLWDGSRMQDLGTLGGCCSSGSAINASGQVTGFALTAGGLFRAFLWDGTRLKNLGTLGGTVSNGFAINASGQVTGHSFTAGDAALHAFLWDGCRTSVRWGAREAKAMPSTPRGRWRVTPKRPISLPTPSSGTARGYGTSARWGSGIVLA
jgi:probable HAF family extracellular repeat protein